MEFITILNMVANLVSIVAASTCLCIYFFKGKNPTKRTFILGFILANICIASLICETITLALMGNNYSFNFPPMFIWAFCATKMLAGYNKMKK